jgi:type IV pilus assembly protein PilO
MATSGAMRDFARLPPQRKAMVFVVIGALLGLLYWQFVYKSLNNKLDSTRALQQTKVRKNTELDKNIEDYGRMRDALPELQARNAANQRALPVEADRPALWEMLGPKIAQSGVTFAGSEDKPELAVENFVRVPVEVTVKGSFMQIKRFFALLAQRDIAPQSATEKKDLEDRERIVSIDSLVLALPDVKNRDYTLTAKFTATTFRQNEKPAAKPGQPGQPAQPNANPPPGQGSGAPLPPANTPAGAKARVEDARDKHDANVRNAQGIDEAKTPASGSAQLKKGVP